MDLLSRLDGRRLGRGTLRLLHVRRGRFPEERRFGLGLRGEGAPLLEGIAFDGRDPIRPWMEFDCRPGPLAPVEREELFRLLGRAVGPGGHLSVKYEPHPESAMALAAGVPPPATPLGLLLWTAGCRWFKDWYYPEGWLEGDAKLQGNIPLDADHRRRRESEAAAELRGWLRRSGGFEPRLREVCIPLGRRVLASISK